MAIYVSYLNIQDSAVTPANTWNTYASTDSGNNTGWNFSTTELGVNVTSVTGVGQTGNASVIGIGNINLTGVQGIGQIGTATVGQGIGVTTTGLQASGQIGSVAIGIGVPVNGVQAVGKIGDVNISAGVTVNLTGVQATGIIGQVLVWGQVDDDQDPNWHLIAA